MARTLHNWMRGLVFLVLVLGTAWILRSYRLAIELKNREHTATASTHAAVDLRTAFQSLGGDSHVQATTKPWVDDLAGYEQAHAGRWIIGQSKRACVSQSEAIAAARDDAANKIGNLIQTPDLPPEKHDWIVRRIAADVRKGQMQTDSAAEQFDRPYGTIWVGSVLVDASPEHLKPLILQYGIDANERMLMVSAIRLAAIGIMAMAWLAYFPINFATKGFFARRLRFSATAITAAVVLFLV
jgi:hypothetical protein